MLGIQAHHHLIGKGAHIRVVQSANMGMISVVLYHPADKTDEQRAAPIVRG